MTQSKKVSRKKESLFLAYLFIAHKFLFPLCRYVKERPRLSNPEGLIKVNLRIIGGVL